LILGKIIKIVATICHILRLEDSYYDALLCVQTAAKSKLNDLSRPTIDVEDREETPSSLV